MRTTACLAAAVVLVVVGASSAAADSLGYADTATITNFWGSSNTVGGSGGGGPDPDWAIRLPMSTSCVLPHATTPGTANRITIVGVGTTVQIDFTYSSGYESNYWKTESPNLLIHLGVPGSREAVEKAGTLRVYSVSYRVDGVWGSANLLSDATYSGGYEGPTGLAALTSVHTVGNAPGSPSEITGVRLTLMSLADSTTFWIAGVHGSPVPEPGTLALLGLGVAGLAWHRGRKRASAA